MKKYILGNILFYFGIYMLSLFCISLGKIRTNFPPETTEMWQLACGVGIYLLLTLAIIGFGAKLIQKGKNECK